MTNKAPTSRILRFAMLLLLSLVALTLVTASALSEADAPQYDAIYDINGDGKIDIVDIELVASRWGAEATPVATLSPTSTPGECTGEQNVSGLIISDTRWVSTCTYNVVDNVAVDAGVTLTVEPGTVVKFAGRYHLQVAGTLVAQGTADERVVFTSLYDSPTWDQRWIGLKFTGGQQHSSILQYVTIEDVDSTAIAVDETPPPYIADSVIRPTRHWGITISNPDGAVVIERNLIECTEFCWDGISVGSGMSVMPLETVSIHHNTIGGASPDMRDAIDVGAYFTSESLTFQVRQNNISASDISFRAASGAADLVLDAENNWWGTTDPAEIEESIYHHNDDINVPWVDYEPFASGPIPGAP